MIERLLFGGVVAVVLLAPLPFGSYTRWAEAAVAIVVALLMTGWGAAVALGRVKLRFDLARIGPGLMLVALAVAWIVYQSLPLPPGNPIWAEVARGLGGDAVRPSATVSRADTVAGLMRLLSYVGIFLLSVQLCRRDDRARIALKAIAYAGGIYAVYGLVIYFTGSKTILHLQKWVFDDDVTATFVNRSNYGCFAALTLLCCLALGWSAISREGVGGVARSIRFTMAVEQFVSRGLVFLVIAAVLVLSIGLSHSRSALLSSVAGGLAFLLAVAISPGAKLKMAAWGAVVCAVLGVVMMLAGGDTLDRFVNGIRPDDRVALFQLVEKGIATRPLTGYGYGTFAGAFMGVRDVTLPLDALYANAHNNFLEIAMEMGLPAAGLLVAGIAMLWIRCLIGARIRRRAAVFPAVAFGATVVVAVQSLTDFAMSVPAVAALYSFLLGLGCGQSFSSREGGTSVHHGHAHSRHSHL